MKRFRASLSVKLSFYLILTTTLLLGIVVLTTMRLHRRHLMGQVYSSADRIGSLIRRSMHDAMMRNEREQISKIIASVAREPGILKVRIYNKEGRISYSSQPSEVGTVVDKKTESCTVCHGKGTPPVDLVRSKRARDYTTVDGNHVLGVIVPIASEPGCVSASCHAHGSSSRMLGVLDVIMELDTVDREMNDQLSQMALIYAAAIAVVCLVSVVFILRTVDRPLGKILRGTQRLAGGDLQTRIDVDSDDEIGELASSFNRMTAELHDARREITRWTQTLEKQVDERTAQLRSAQEKVIQAEKMASIGKLAAIVAHEINNPLAGIRTYAKLLQRKLEKIPPFPESEDYARNLGIIETESARCGEITRNLLMFSRPSEVTFEKHDVNDLVARSVSLVKHQIDLLGAEVQLDLSGDPIPATCDGKKIQQALVAILINACEAMPSGQGKVRIATRRVAEPPGVEIAVGDNGAGMDEETMAHIFEPFFTTKEKNGRGTSLGLGLAVVREIVDSHKGRVSVTSRVGEGTTFAITLPENPTGS